MIFGNVVYILHVIYELCFILMAAIYSSFFFGHGYLFLPFINHRQQTQSYRTAAKFKKIKTYIS